MFCVNEKWFGIVVGVAVCLTALSVAQGDWPEQQELLGEAEDHFGDSVSISGDYAIVGAHLDDVNGSAYIFTPNDVDPNNWDQQTKLLALDGSAGDEFGISVSISADYAIVGVHKDDATGSAYVFKRSDVPGDPNWYQQGDKLIASDGAAGDEFGYWVSICGDHAIVGAFGDDSYRGSAYIFTPNDVDPNNWDQQGPKLLASDGTAGDRFGGCVSISGDYAIVGAYRDDSSRGSAYIFTPNDVDPNHWDQQTKLLASDGASDDYFGHGVSISGDYAIVGAYRDDSLRGSAYIFKRDGESWTEQVKLTASDGVDGDHFGTRVCMSGNYAVIAAVHHDAPVSDCGCAYLFKRRGTSWIEVAKLTASDAATGDYFGHGVSITGEHAIVGAPTHDHNGDNSGSAYIFERVCPISDLTDDCWVDFKDFAIMGGEWLHGN